MMTRMDEMVAEHVMGYAVWPCDPAGEIWDYDEDDFEHVRFRPSSNIMHAFMVVNHMVEKRGYDFSMHIYADNMGDELIYYVQFQYPEKRLQFFADEPAPTLSICRAAIKAVTS